MKETSYYELKMPDSNDTIDVSVLNNNMKRLDDVLILTVIGRNAETSEFVKKCCAPYIMIQNLGEETVTIYDRRWPEDMWEDNKIVIEPSKFHIYRVANSVNANFLVLDNKECNFRYFITAEQAIAEGGGGGGGGTTDYNDLENQPKVNGIVLVGNKSFKELGLLNDDGKIKSDYLPPFVDNMDSYDTEADFPRPGVEDRLYLDKSTNLAYVWAGTDYACIGTPLALGITHETAGYGDESRAAYNHSLSKHARVDATKTEGSSQNGYVKINEVETKVYEHPGTGTNPHGTTKADVGLSNVGNFKAVSTVASQGLTDTEKANAKANLGISDASSMGVDTSIASSATDNNVPTTKAVKTALDDKVQKTSVSSGDKTTSTIAITDNSQMAMVAKISGKTVKDGTTLKSAAVESVVSCGKNIAKLFAQHTAISSDGKISNDSGSNNYDTYIVRVRQGENYIIQSEDAAGKVYAFYSTYPSINSTVSYNGSRTIAANGSVTAPISGYLVFRTIHTRTSWANKGSTLLDYEPYNETTVLVPSEARNCVGYGLGISDSVCNIADFENGVYNRNVFEINLGDLTWSLISGTHLFTASIPNRKAALLNGVCSKYGVYSSGDRNNVPDKMISAYASNNNGVCVHDTAYSDATAFKTAMAGVKLVCELATPETIPLTDFIRPLPVENGGTLTLVNPHNLDVNSTIKYKKEI